MSTEDIRHAHEEASLSWTGCDWHTRFGKQRLDLQGMRSPQAAELAGQSLDKEAAEFARAADWLAEVELQAAAAEEAGWKALTAADAGNLPEALCHAQQACWLEQGSGRTEHRPAAWPRVCFAVSQAMKGEGQEPEPSVTLSRAEFTRMVHAIGQLRNQAQFQRRQLYALNCQLKELGVQLEDIDLLCQRHDPARRTPKEEGSQ